MDMRNICKNAGVLFLNKCNLIREVSYLKSGELFCFCGEVQILLKYYDVTNEDYEKVAKWGMNLLDIGSIRFTYK